MLSKAIFTGIAGMIVLFSVHMTATAGIVYKLPVLKRTTRHTFTHPPVFTTLAHYEAYKNEKALYGDDSAKAYIRRLAINDHQPIRRSTAAIVKAANTASGFDPVYFQQGGNAFGANAVIGTTDNYGIDFNVNNINLISISSDGTFVGKVGGWYMTQSGVTSLSISSNYGDGLINAISDLGQAAIGDWQHDFNNTSVLVDDIRKEIITTGNFQSTEGSYSLNADGSGWLANGAVTWTADGEFSSANHAWYFDQSGFTGFGGCTNYPDQLFGTGPSGIAWMGDINGDINNTYIAADDQGKEIDIAAPNNGNIKTLGNVSSLEGSYNLNADGSGWVGNGHITWDTAGNLSGFLWYIGQDGNTQFGANNAYYGDGLFHIDPTGIMSIGDAAGDKNVTFITVDDQHKEIDLSTSGGLISITGKVGIGTTTPTEALSVNGNIRAKQLIIVQTGWPDYVFDSAYQLQPLTQVAQYIQNNKHLPGIPSAQAIVDGGLNVGDNQAALLKKIEELTLYIITQDKKQQQVEQLVDSQSKLLQQQQQLLLQMQAQLDKLKQNRQ